MQTWSIQLTTSQQDEACYFVVCSHSSEGKGKEASFLVSIGV